MTILENFDVAGNVEVPVVLGDDDEQAAKFSNDVGTDEKVACWLGIEVAGDETWCWLGCILEELIFL